MKRACTKAVAFELELTGFTDGRIDSSVNEGVTEAKSKTSVSVTWVHGEDNKQDRQGKELLWGES